MGLLAINVFSVLIAAML